MDNAGSCVEIFAAKIDLRETHLLPSQSILDGYSHPETALSVILLLSGHMLKCS